MASFARAMVRSGGVGSLYAGLGATVAKHTAHSCFYFAAFHETKKFAPKGTSRFQQICWDLLSGFVAGCAAATANNPFDVVKTRQQVVAASALSSHAAGQEFACGPTSVASVAMELVRRDGWAGLYKGYIAKVARLGPGSALIFCTYEQVMSLFH